MDHKCETCAALERVALSEISDADLVRLVRAQARLNARHREELERNPRGVWPPCRLVKESDSVAP